MTTLLLHPVLPVPANRHTEPRRAAGEVRAAQPATLRLDRSKRMAALLTAIAALNVFDLAATVLFMCTIGMFESNPLVVQLAKVTGSAEAIALFKIATASTGITILYRVRDRFQAEVASWLLVLILLFVCGRWVAYSVHALELAEYAASTASDPSWVLFE